MAPGEPFPQMQHAIAFSYNTLHIRIPTNQSLFSVQLFPNEDLRILRRCVSIRDKLLQKKYDEHKVKYNNLHIHFIHFLAFSLYLT